MHTRTHANTCNILQTDPIMMVMMGGGGLNFSDETGYRDVFLQDTCDNGCRRIAQLLGLEVYPLFLITVLIYHVLLQDRLMSMMEEEHKRLDSEISSMMSTLSLGDNQCQPSSGLGHPPLEPMEGSLATSELPGSSEEPMEPGSPRGVVIMTGNESSNDISQNI